MLMHMRNSKKQRRRHRRIADRPSTASGLVDALRAPETT